MALVYQCDGCGCAVQPDDATELGHVKKAQYCAACGTIAKQFAADMDRIHDEAANLFAVKRAQLLTQFKLDRPGFKELPDGAFDFVPVAPGEAPQP